MEEFVEAYPKQNTVEQYEAFFAKYEAELLEDIKDGKVRFSLEAQEAEKEETAPTELPPPPAVPKPKRPSFQYPGFYEPD
jgi:hypothetical protein